MRAEKLTHVFIINEQSFSVQNRVIAFTIMRLQYKIQKLPTPSSMVNIFPDGEDAHKRKKNVHAAQNKQIFRQMAIFYAYKFIKVPHNLITPCRTALLKTAKIVDEQRITQNPRR